MADTKDFPLGVSGFHFSDLYNPLRLKALHRAFWDYVSEVDPDAQKKFETGGAGLTKPQESELLIETARHVGEFVARLFNVGNQALKLKKETQQLYSVFRLKKDFLNIKVFKRYEEPALPAASFKEIEEKVRRLLQNEPPKSSVEKKDPEVAFADIVIFLVDCEKKLKTGLDAVETQRLQNLCNHIATSEVSEKIQFALKAFEDWCVQMWVDPARRKGLDGWISFVRPNKLDFEHLVHTESLDLALPERVVGPREHLRFRDGFKLTDPRMNQKEFLREIDYCILCHQREKDSCNHGFPEKTGGFKTNPLGIPLAGCPLDERISEMHLLRKEGEVIASLAMIMLDNPMCPGTGHRICNDCMKGCIFQKQDPVNIPQAETGVLTDVLEMPYGFEIYSLFTRFNPLSRERPYALPYNGNDVLVVGLGPAGYTLAHYLANEGFGVVGIDGLKLEPMDAHLSGVGKPMPKPVQNFSELKKSLDDRVLMGFGGVSEYGITVRWDKTFLGVIYLTLLRRQNVKFYGGVRFGGTLSLEDAWDLGFKHIAIATGAGKPTIINMKNNLARGIRKASDFLMALQLTGAFKRSALANLQVQLPAIVIGGGLTAVDTATELLAYYPVQVEKTLERFETLARETGEEIVWKTCSDEDKGILATQLEHGKAIREERKLAQKEKRNPNFIALCEKWGGVSLAYRKRLIDSPAYRLNHEEVVKALEEGISFIENMTPIEAHKNAFGSVEAMTFKRGNGEMVKLPAKSVCVAAGTSPNIVYEKERPGSFALDEEQYFFQKHVAVEKDGKWIVEKAKPEDSGAFFLSHSFQGKLVSFYGDNHPDYAGNVVKAMASAKHGLPHVRKLFQKAIELADVNPADMAPFIKLTTFLDEALVPRVVKVQRLTPTIVEVIVKAKYAAQKFEPGQFYRLQNYETLTHAIDGSRLIMEGLALTGAWVDKEKDLLSMIVLEMGTSSRLCAMLKTGDPVVVMGPTGAPSEIPKDETVLLAGGGLGNAVLLSIAKACREAGSKTIYFAGYRRKTDLFKQQEIEDVTDQVIWSVDAEDPIPARRDQDCSFVGNIVQAMDAYASGKLKPKKIGNRLQDVDRIIAIGSDRMMEAVGKARHGILKPHLKQHHIAIASINSSMQCMMKEVCAQCLQRHVDPVTGKESFVFSCFNQDQEMDHVDFANLKERLRVNGVAEMLSNRYLDYLLQKGKIERI